MPEINTSIAIPAIKQYTTSAKVSAAALRQRAVGESMVHPRLFIVNILLIALCVVVNFGFCVNL